MASYTEKRIKTYEDQIVTLKKQITRYEGILEDLHRQRQNEIEADEAVRRREEAAKLEMQKERGTEPVSDRDIPATGIPVLKSHYGPTGIMVESKIPYSGDWTLREIRYVLYVQKDPAVKGSSHRYTMRVPAKNPGAVFIWMPAWMHGARVTCYATPRYSFTRANRTMVKKDGGTAKSDYYSIHAPSPDDHGVKFDSARQ